jgi:bile acid:Na+ symporter, BASS family
MSIAKPLMALGLGGCLFGLISTYVGGYTVGGIILLCSMTLIILGMLQIPTLSSYIFTIVIFMAATSALYFPFLYQNIYGFNMSSLIVPILMVIMFGMGTGMELKDFYGVIKMPQGVLVGMACQFSIMPLIGLALAHISLLSPEVAAGIILVGCSPSGLASNVMSYIAKANVALSITLTMCATLVAPILTPFLMKTFANQYVPIDFWSMFMSIIKIVFLPIIAGLLFNKIFNNYRSQLSHIMPRVSMIGIALVITIITAAGRDSLLDIGLILIVIVVIHNLLGYSLGYCVASLIGMDQASRRTIALEVGMQNSGLASGIAMEMGKIATMGLAPAVFGPFMNITGSTLASYWAGKTDKN